MKTLNIVISILAVLLFVGVVFCASVGIASLVNNVSFGQQIVNWFKPAKDAVETTAQLFLR